MVAVIGEQRLRPAKISQLDSVAHLLKHAVSAGVALAAISAIGVLAIAAGGTVSPSAALLGDLLVSGVDILHLLLRQIRQLNDRIADETLSLKIDRIEQVSGRIFKAIEDDPGKKDAAGTFLNYYLPTTLKLLENYADFEEAGVSGENLSQAKSRIAATMDNIVAGFEHQLDELYRTDAMDVDSDIRVMETMLRRDTASAADDFGLGGAAVQRQSEEE